MAYEASTKTFTVATSDELNQAIADVDAIGRGGQLEAGAYKIVLGSDIELGTTASGNIKDVDGSTDLSVNTHAVANSAELKAINLSTGTTLEIDGAGKTIDGNGAYRGLFVYNGQVSIHDLTITDMLAAGGEGSGGGAGLGGGLFIAGANGASEGGDVTLSNVAFTNNKAVGGASTGFKGAGGGMGGDAASSGGGGVGTQAIGGYAGSNAQPDKGAGAVAAEPGGDGGAGLIVGAASGAAGSDGNTGNKGAGAAGGAGGFSGGGGGGVGGSGTYGIGGTGGGGGGVGAFGATGGFGGGGAYKGAGGFGGGGGYKGAGGFGGGGGTGALPGPNGVDANGGFGGGNNGGGGLGAGGAIFVQEGGKLTLSGGLIVGGPATGTSNSAAGGTSPQGIEGFSGFGFGSGIYLQGTNTVTFSPSAQAQTVYDVIGDDAGSAAAASYTGPSGYTPGSVTIAKTGAGTLILSAVNTYSGGTTLSAGTLELGQLTSAGTAAITFGTGAQTLQLDVSGTLTNTLSSFGGGDAIDLTTIDPTGATMSMSGNMLTVTEAAASGTDSNTLMIGAAPTGYVYALSSDGAGGTKVTLEQSGAPATPAAPVLTNDTGTSSTDNITRDPTITYPTPATGDTLLYSTNGETYTSTAPTFATDGTDDGQHTVFIKERNGSGELSGASSLTFTLDTVRPAGPTSIALAPAQDTGSSSSDGITSVNSFNISGTGLAGSTINLYRDAGVLLGTQTVANDGTYAFTTPVLVDGLHSLYTATTDVAGNRSATSNLIKVTVDTAAPLRPAAPTLSPASDTGTQGDGQTSITRPVITGTAEGGSTVTLYDTNGTTVLGSAVAASNGAYAITSSSLSDGQHQLSVKATDKAGNTSTASPTTSVTIVRPAAPDMVARSDSGISSTDDLTNVRTPTFSGKTDAYATIKLYEGDTLLGTGRSGADGVYSVTSSGLGDGTHLLKITVTDRSGHVSSLSDALTIKIDTSAPAAPSSPALTMASDTGSSSSDGITSDTTPTVTGTAEAGSTVTLYRDKGVQIGSMTLGTTDTAYSFTTPTLSEGAHSLYAVATDAAGNRSGVSVQRKMTIDTQAPNVAIGGGNRTVSSANQTISGTGEAGTTIAITNNNTDMVSFTTVASNGTWSKAVTLSPGQNQFVATDTDKAGNVGNSNTVTVTYTSASAMRSLHSMVQAMATMNPSSSAALTASAPVPVAEAHLAAAHA